MSVGLLVRHHPSSPALVRQQLTRALAEHSIAPQSIDDVVLVASELVANAVRHAPPTGDLDVAWTITAESVLIEVCDASPDLPRLLPAAPTALGGRGLMIVDALASDWGADLLPDGKRVWARVRLGALTDSPVGNVRGSDR